MDPMSLVALWILENTTISHFLHPRKHEVWQVILKNARALENSREVEPGGMPGFLKGSQTPNTLGRGPSAFLRRSFGFLIS